MCLISWKRAITLEAYEHEVETRSSSTFSVERPGSASVRVTSFCVVYPSCNTSRTEFFLVSNLNVPNVPATTHHELSVLWVI